MRPKQLPTGPERVLRAYLTDATQELFESYEIALTRRPAEEDRADPDTLRVLASVGYVGQGMRGSVLVLTAAATATTWGAAHFLDLSDDLLRDVVGEFANMLVGRLKNRLRAHGQELSIAIPTTVIGRNLRVSAPVGCASLWERFDSEHGVVSVCVDLSVAEGFTMPERPASTAPAVAAEGDMLLF